MVNSIQLALRSDKDLSTPTTLQNYPLGFEYVEDNGHNVARNVYKYVKASAGLMQYGAYVILPSFTAGAEWGTATPATSAIAKEFGIAQSAFNANEYGFLLVEGKGTAVSAGATTLGNTASLTNGATTLTDEAGVAETAKTVAILGTTAGGAGNVSVMIKRKLVTI